MNGDSDTDTQHFPSQFREALHKFRFRSHIAYVLFASLLQSQIPSLVKRTTPFRPFQIPTAAFDSIADVDITILNDVPSLLFQMDDRRWGIAHFSHNVIMHFSSLLFLSQHTFFSLTSFHKLFVSLLLPILQIDLS